MDFEHELMAAEGFELSEFLDSEGVRSFTDDTCESRLSLIERVQLYATMKSNKY